MSSPSNTVVSLRELPKTLDIELPNAFVREALQGMPMRAALDRPEDDAHAGAAQVHADLYSEGSSVFVRGRIQGWFEVACSRCLGAARVQLNEQLSITYLPKAQLPSDDEDDDEAASLRDGDSGRRSKGAGHGPAAARSQAAGGQRGAETMESDEELGVELGEEDLDLYPYEGEEVDLAPLFRDQLVLAVPFAPLCREDCQGLCPQCGIDRNRESCNCEPPIDPRLAAIKDIKI